MKMKTLLTIALALALCLPAAGLRAADDEGEFQALKGRERMPLKMEEAIRLGLTRNLEVRRAILDRITQREAALLAKRYFEPRVYLSGSYTHTAAGNTDTRGVGVEVTGKLPTAGELTFSWKPQNLLQRQDDGGDTFQSTVSLNLTQPLLRGAGLTVGTAPLVTADYTEAVSHQAFRRELMDKIVTIQSAYWSLLTALEGRLSAIRSLKSAQEVLRRNQALIKAGRRAQADLVAARQEVARNRLAVLDQELAVEQANRALINLLNLEDNVAILPAEGFVFHQVQVDHARLLAEAMKRNPQLIQARVALKQAKLDLELARSQALDQLDLSFGFEGYGDDSSLGGSIDQSFRVRDGWQAGLGLTIPLGLPRAELKHTATVAARAVTKAKLALEQETLRVKQEVRDGVNDVRRSLRQIKLAQLSRQLALRKYDIERTRLELGRSSNFQVISYQRDLTEARDQEHAAIAAYLNALANLDRAVGNTLQTWGIKAEVPAPPKVPSLLRQISQGR